jgi:vacuolar-type H+-ATPase subunit E/Vma4
MSQTSLIEKIKQDAAQVVAEIEAASAAEIETITQETNAVVAATEAANKAALEKHLAHLELVAISKAKQAGNIAFQSAKRAEIDALFAELQKEIIEMDETSYVAFVTAVATSILPEKIVVEKILAPASRTTETEKVLKTVHLDGDIAAAPITAGLIVHAKDGVYDASIDRLITERRPELEIKLMKLIEAK